MGPAIGLVAMAVQAASPATTTPPAPTAPAVAPSPQLARRVDGLLALLGGNGDFDTLFAPSFRNAIPKAQFDQLTAKIVADLGKPTGVETLESATSWKARLRIGFQRGVLTAEIAVDPTVPHQITGLLFKGVEPLGGQATTLDAVVAQLAALPGTSVFALSRLEDGPPRLIEDRHATTPIAIGSAFKLVILAELVRSIEAGERKWSDGVTLDGSALPGGGYAQQPRGTRIALRELAERMISVSDNSATDILLFHLGRQRVEAMLPVVGFIDGGTRNVPFLGALELFKLKGVEGGALGTRYLSFGTAARRTFLDGTVRDTPIAAIPRDLFQNGRPLRIAELEWFASPNDLIRAMDWLRRRMSGPAGADLRAILSKNPGLPDATGHWRYVGYKGGSEPGVLTMTFLLQAKDGGWYAMAAGVNDPSKDIETLKFTGLMARALDLAAPR